MAQEARMMTRKAKRAAEKAAEKARHKGQLKTAFRVVATVTLAGALALGVNASTAQPAAPSGSVSTPAVGPR